MAAYTITLNQPLNGFDAANVVTEAIRNAGKVTSVAIVATMVAGETKGPITITFSVAGAAATHDAFTGQLRAELGAGNVAVV